MCPTSYVYVYLRSHTIFAKERKREIERAKEREIYTDRLVGICI